MNSQFQYIRELGQEKIKSNKFKCKSKATNELDSQKVIHEGKKITTLTVVWISEATPIWFCELKRWISSKLLVCERSYTFFVLNSTRCFIQYPESLKWVLQNLAALFFFKPLVGVWISHETLYLVFDIDIFGEMTLDETCVSFLTLLLL